jgi:hypothetical protein
MTGIQLPSSPTETPSPHPADRGPVLVGSPSSGPARSTAGSRPVLFLVVVVALAVTVVGLTVTIVSVIMENTRLRAEAVRLADDVEGLAAEIDQLTAQQAQLADGFAAWFGEDEPWEEPPAEALFEGTVMEERDVTHMARYRFDATAGQLLGVELVPDVEDRFVAIELFDDRGGIGAFAENVAAPFGGNPSLGGTAQLWYRFEVDAAVTLGVYVDEAWATDMPPSARLTAALHDLAEEPVVVVEVSEGYPTDGSLPTFGFEALAGQLAIVTMTSERPEVLAPSVRLYGPAEELIGTGQDGAAWGEARLAVRLPADGRYEVEADRFDGLPPRGEREHAYALTVELLDLP